MLRNRMICGLTAPIFCTALSLLAEPGIAQQTLTVGSPLSIRLQAAQTQRITIATPVGFCSRLELQLNGGLVAIASSRQPRLGIDLGRSAVVPYIAANVDEAKDDYIDLSSLEHTRAAEMKVVLISTTACTEDDLKLRHMESELAAADSARHHWKNAPSTAEAATLYQEAAALAAEVGNISLQRLAETQHARFLLFQETRFAEAQVLLQHALALPSANDAPEQALAFKTLSSLEADLGDYDAAIADSARALSLYQAAGDVYWQGIVVGNISSVYAELGQYSQAAQAASDALADAKAVMDIAGVVYSLAELANTYRLEGDFEAAFRAFHEGLDWVDSISYSPLVEAEIRDQMATYYANMGQWQQAADQLHRCLRLEDGRDNPTALEARGTLAGILQQQHRYVASQAAYAEAIDTARRLQLRREQAMLLLERAHSKLSAGRRDEALADIATADEIFKTSASPAFEVQVALALGDVWSKPEPQKSEDSFDEARQIALEIGDREDEAVALAGMAAAEHAQHNEAEALSSMNQALNLLEHTRSTMNSRQLAVSYFAMHRGWYNLAVDIAMTLAAKHGDAPQADYVALAFTYTERARARALLDAVRSAGGDTDVGLPKRLQQSMVSNQHEIEDKQAALSTAESTTSGAIASSLLRLYQQQDALQAQARAIQPAKAGLLPGDIASVADIQQKLLNSHTTLLSFWLGDGHSYRWLITPTRLEAIRLPGRGALEHSILPLERDLRRRQTEPFAGEDAKHYSRRESVFEGSLLTQLAHTGSLLLSGIPPEVERIYVVGDGPLFALPWSALRLHTENNTRFAIERYAFLNEPSASVAVDLRSRSAGQTNHHIAIVFDGASVEDGASADNGLMLTSATQEAHDIKKLGGNAVLLLAGSRGRHQFDNSDFAVLHFAAHTVTADGNAELTGIRFGVTNKSSQSTLWLHDIFALKRTAPLVVLSGCDTEGSQQATGEGLNSLAEAFFFTGAHTVVGSLWNVDDAQTTQLMVSMYKALLSNKPDPVSALRAGQLHMLHTGAGVVDWAAFVINGVPSGAE